MKSKLGLIFVSSEPFVQFVKQIKVAEWEEGVGWGKVWDVWRVGQQLPLKGVDKAYFR